MTEENDTSKPTGTSLCKISRSIEKEFINTYKSLPELWDPDNIHYTNKRKRNAALDILLQIVKRWNPAATRYNVRQKINITRSSYRKDLRKYLASKTIGSNGEEFYEHLPKNWKFYALRFLDRVKHEKNESIEEINVDDRQFDNEASEETVSGTEDDYQANDFFEPVNKAEQSSSPQIKRKCNSQVEVDTDNEYYGEIDELLDRELEAIGANVTCKLKRMNPLQRYHAELLINKVLINGLKNNLTDETELADISR